MAGIGGRNRIMAWVVGVLCAAVVVGLAVLTVPLLPATAGWVGEILRNATGAERDDAEEPDAVAADTGHTGTPTECAHLYDDALQAVLAAEPGAALTASQDPPAIGGSVLAALAPQVAMTCSWAADAGTVTTTLAQVPPDAGAIIAAALPSDGFECADDGARVRCVRIDGALRETVEAGGGLWLSTRAEGWLPEGYEARVAERAFA